MKVLGQSLSVAVAIISHLDLYLCVLFKAGCSCVLHRNISRHHDSIMLWLTKWLLFRLMFSSGVVKLTYMDKTWWDLSALNWHYESQVSNQLCFWCQVKAHNEAQFLFSISTSFFFLWVVHKVVRSIVSFFAF